MTFNPRPAQMAVLDYQGGKMGVSAVPGSGKTVTLSYLAAQLVGRGVHEGQEVLVVTFANSAVDNFKQRITGFVRAEGLLPQVGYRVRTLHGLAHDIVRERPGLAGLSEEFQILDERISGQIRDQVAALWLREHPDALEPFLAPDLDERALRQVFRRQWPDLAQRIAEQFIRRAKDLQLSPMGLRTELGAALREAPLSQFPLLKMGLEIYEDYQRALSQRGGVDFDDLIRMALEILQADPDLLSRLCYRWPYILEDEAQDSSYLQEQILRLLSKDGNWVRVGDPNQAINTTFTTADPHFLRQFLREPDTVWHTLPDSGRSTTRIIDLANYLVDWTCTAHPNPWLRDGHTAAFLSQYIQPTPPDDPQPNPADDPAYVVHLHDQRYTPDDELRDVVRSLARWLPAHRDRTVAVLVPINARGFKLAEMLHAQKLPYEELLRSTARTRQAAGVLEAILHYVSDPLNPARLAGAFNAWDQNRQRAEEADRAPGQEIETAHAIEIKIEQRAQQAKRARARLAQLLRGCRQPEAFLYPGPGQDALAALPDGDALEDQACLHLLAFCEAACHWMEASILPIDQLVLTLAQELFTAPADLALAFKLALVLQSHATQYPDKRLPELVQELSLIAHNQRRFLGFDEADLGYQPKPGVITVTTMHKAKGLEWDRVYLVGVNNYNFPSAEPHDYYRGESWFVRDGLNLGAETIAQLEQFKQGKLAQYLLGPATEKARIDYTAERLRLLYVGITRAQRELVMTWNSGHAGFEPKVPAAPFIALHTFWEARQDEEDVP